MSKTEALKQLEEKREITTGMLKYLPMSFDMWLKYCQADKKLQDQVVDLSIETIKALD